MGDNSIKNIVARKMRGLPLLIEEPQIRKDKDGVLMCIDCGDYPIAEKGTQAHAHGLCSSCASWKRRHGEWSTKPLDDG